jgi:uncharacterized protein DUF3105
MSKRSLVQSKRERRQVQQRQAAQAERTRRFVIGGVVAVLVLIVLGAVWQSGVLNPAPTPAVQASSGSCSNVQSFPSLGQEHIASGQQHVPYNSNPPSSGPHLDTPQNWGIYTVPQIQEQLVHNLEHGGVVIQYNNLSGPEVQQLTGIVQRDRYHIILAPYPGLPSEAKIALTAWTGVNGNPALQAGKLLYCTGVDENAIQAFINAYRDKGPELVP